MQDCRRAATESRGQMYRGSAALLVREGKKPGIPEYKTIEEN